MHARPETRAAFLKDALRTFDVLPADQAAAVRARMPAHGARRIEEAGRLEWLPARFALDILEAVDAVGGPQGVRRCSMAAIEATLRAPLMLGFVEAGRALLSPTPRGLVRVAASAWPLHYRNAGELVVAEDDSDGLRVLHPGLPAELQVAPWLLSMATCIERVAAIADPRARADFARGRAGVTYVVRFG